MFKSSARFQIN